MPRQEENGKFYVLAESITGATLIALFVAIDLLDALGFRHRICPQACSASTASARAAPVSCGFPTQADERFTCLPGERCNAGLFE
jgi:hypothetical protein